MAGGPCLALSGGLSFLSSYRRNSAAQNRNLRRPSIAKLGSVVLVTAFYSWLIN
ncbi:MAG: hypothetical protein M3Q05_14960 [Bacteroidota bacterium]|nr:hypothetical protein [Bacteroidota bacterium]